MINVFFVPGMFGTTVEYVLRNYSGELPGIDGKILSDGSMHSFRKEAHLNSIDRVRAAVQKKQKFIVTTPTYPWPDMRLPDIIDVCSVLSGCDDTNILIYADDLESAELNMLFQYYKITVGFKMGLDIFFSGNELNIRNWNESYTHWSQMQRWELREWFSIYYPTWVHEWMISKDQIGDDFFKISNVQILTDPVESFRSIIRFSKLTETRGLDLFSAKWRLAQQYVLDEFGLIKDIVDASINDRRMFWHDLNIIAESIIQNRLRSQGYEIKCHDLNTFPIDSKSLYNLLYRI